MNHNYIAIEGNIGVGKTTLCKQLAQIYDADLLLESFDNQSFLPQFYQDPDRYALSLETSFLTERYQQIRAKLSTPNLFKGPLFADYTFERSLLFASVTLSEKEYRHFYKLYHSLKPNLPQPDLILFLYAPEKQLIKNIKARGRDFEQDISLSYLEKISDRYFEFLHRQKKEQPILLIDREEVDFTGQNNHIEQLCEHLQAKYPPGLYPVEFETKNS